jgi:hypothetical protein
MLTKEQFALTKEVSVKIKKRFAVLFMQIKKVHEVLFNIVSISDLFIDTLRASKILPLMTFIPNFFASLSIKF